ncbi:SAM-dependent methyltransferase [Amycolatopsis sp., V23-08]|uniref:SAM-dependent methyltransferase n=1 Tax=Amycolatopsis heterodermiae TaxID=3110235 RepID=A0ABU5R4I0_9PSEU|nr:SAM-dependent methyltransferase [Amycolatopsis sp., V23-08]MEA5360216.1 SAM-dependent methyltransferase [Amycolatopsis sp., V23-08]
MSDAPSAVSGTVSPSQKPVGLDPERPSIARIYDGFLGGHNFYEVDRVVMEKIRQAVPEAVDIARGNRGFHNRALRMLASQTKIRQFVDCGSGLPTAENTHQIVQRIDKDTNVVYIDNDPVVLAHGRALLAENDFTHMVEADIFKPEAVLDNDEVLRHIDFAEPVALLHVGTMHHFEGDGAADVMRAYIDALAPGSYVVLSHFFDPEVPELTAIAKRIEDILTQGPLGAGRFRTRTEIEAMLAGLEFLQPNATSEPGLAVCDEWWPDGPRLTPLSGSAKCVAGIVGVKR